MRLAQAGLSSLNTFGTLRGLSSKQWPLQTLTVTFPDFTTEKAQGSCHAGFFSRSSSEWGFFSCSGMFLLALSAYEHNMSLKCARVYTADCGPRGPAQQHAAGGRSQQGAKHTRSVQRGGTLW